MTEKQKRFADEYVIDNCFGVVYRITNMTNNKVYIGITRRSIEERFNEHCKANSLIGKAIRKYGRENFQIEQIDYADNHDELIELEMLYIEKHNSFRSGYNLTIGGDGVTSYVINSKLTNKQKDFCMYVEFVENKKEIDVDNAAEMGNAVMLNLLVHFLKARLFSDKKKSAELIVRLKRELKDTLISLRVVNYKEIEDWAAFKNIKDWQKKTLLIAK